MLLSSGPQTPCACGPLCGFLEALGFGPASCGGQVHGLEAFAGKLAVEAAVDGGFQLRRHAEAVEQRTFFLLSAVAR